MRLKDEVVIVTGASRNIGAVYAKALAAEGAKIIAADILSASKTVDEIKEAGGEATEVTVDVSDEHAVQQMAETANDTYGKISSLLNNAALYYDLSDKPFSDISVEEWDRVMAVNLRGVFLCCRAVVPYMKETKKGRIINIASNTIFKGTPGLAHYVASKAGVVGFSRTLARECGDFGINVNVVAPDFIPHERNLKEKPGHVQMIQESRAIKRREVPEDMIGTIVFLLSPDSDFITGQTIAVNGGSIMCQ